MATIDLTASAKSVFLSENYFNRQADKESDLTVSTGSTLKHRLYDMDRDAQWSSAGSDDTTTETIEAGFYLPGMLTTRSVDYVAVMNHNIKGLSIELSADGGTSWTSVFSSAAVTDSDTRVTIASAASYNRIRITMTTTQTADAEKLVGLVVVALSTFQVAAEPISYVPRAPRVQHKTARMADGSIRRAPIWRSDANFNFWTADLAFYVTDESSELTNFRNLAFNGDPFLVMVRPGDNTTEIFQCEIVPGTYQQALWSNPTVITTRRVSFTLEEIGGA